MMNLKAIPHTKLVIQFIGTAAVTLVPKFKGGIVAPFKRIRHFYGMPNLSDFYTPTKALSGLKDASGNYLVYGVGVDESEYPVSLEYPGLTGPQQDFFDMDPDTVKLAADNVKWEVEMPSGEPYEGKNILPYVNSISGGLTNLAVGTLEDDIVPIDGSVVHDVGVPKTFIIKFKKGTTYAAVWVNLNDSDVQAGSGVDILATGGEDYRRDIAVDETFSFGDAGCTVFYDDTAGQATISFSDETSGITEVTAMSLDQLTVVPYPDDPTVDGRWFYTALDATTTVAKTLLSVMRGIQGYGTVSAGDLVEDSDGNFHSFVKVAELDGYSDVWDLSNTVGCDFGELINKSAANVDKLQVFAPFYSFNTTSFYDVDPSGVPGDTLLAITALTTLLTEENDVTEDTMFVGDAHVAYSADFTAASTGNKYMNRVYRSDAGLTDFPLVDGSYKWGLPHPDNPTGFAAYIAGLILSPSSYYYITLSDNKTKGFSLIGKELPRVLFIANLWEEYNQGGLSEASFITNQVSQYDNYPNVYTYMVMNPRVDKRGDEDDYNAYPGTVVEGDYYLTKASGDIEFTGSPAVSIGDYVEILYGTGDTQRIVVTGVESTKLRLSKKTGSSGEVAFKIYTRMTSSSAKSYYESKFSSDVFTLFNCLNTEVEWGSHVISPKWLSLASMLRRLVYPEQQPLTKVALDVGNFGRAYGGFEFFEIEDLDYLVSKGFQIYVSDAESVTSYIERDVSAGIKSDDYRRGNGNAVTPISTFAASCRLVLDPMTGKYNKGDFLKEKVKLSLQAIETAYTKTPSVPDYGAKLRIARFKELRAITGGYKVVLEALPQEQGNIFEIEINVIQETEE